ncbi:MAG: Na+/H+ antiporter subunit E [Nitrococcus mobilis]|nr:Na+/H+ antiporter subunit E [Nitrococcus mobilis]
MSRWLPFPLLSAGLLTMWLLLNQTVAVGHILLGAALALCIAWGTRAVQPSKTRLRRLGAIIRLFFVVLGDIIRSNAAVTWIILRPGQRRGTSSFVDIPLELRNPYGLAVLACIITSTPGTLWAGFDSATGVVTVHILDLIDENAWFDIIKGRYERLLLEIFE